MCWERREQEKSARREKKCSRGREKVASEVKIRARNPDRARSLAAPLSLSALSTPPAAQKQAARCPLPIHRSCRSLLSLSSQVNTSNNSPPPLAHPLLSPFTCLFFSPRQVVVVNLVAVLLPRGIWGRRCPSVVPFEQDSGRGFVQSTCGCESVCPYGATSTFYCFFLFSIFISFRLLHDLFCLCLCYIRCRETGYLGMCSDLLRSDKLSAAPVPWCAPCVFAFMRIKNLVAICVLDASFYLPTVRG